jgi:type I restriction enzyme R subunit
LRLDQKHRGRRYSIQKPLIGYVRGPSAEYVTSEGKKIFANLGWDYVSPADALRLRGGTTGFVFKELFINQMQTLNPDFMNPQLAEELIKRLERIPPNIEGNLVAWEHLQGLRTVFVPAEDRERNVTFIVSSPN